MNKEILLIIDTVSNEKNVDREIIIDAMEHALASAVKKKYKLDNKSQDEIDVQVTINQDDGSYKTLRRWEVVDEMLVDDEYEMKMLLDLAKEKDPKFIHSYLFEFQVSSPLAPMFLYPLTLAV